MKFTFAPESTPLDGYTIKRAIYRGGFGEVYYALSDAGREVALKLLQNNQEVELRGVRQCLNLTHPNLVTIFDVKRDAEGDHWIVMEYVPGETLEAALRRYPSGMPMEAIRRWLKGIVAGVAYLHDRGIVHRDLKPGNVFDDGETIKVGDVGLSKFITPSRRSAHTQSVGTVYYMAPEVARGRYGKEVDVYALGVILYELLTGRVPFEGESTGEILMKHLSEPPDLSKLPDRVRSVIGRALEKDPKQRIASVRELADAFEAAVIGSKIEQPRRSAPLPKTRVAGEPSEPPDAPSRNGSHAPTAHADAVSRDAYHTGTWVLLSVIVWLFAGSVTRGGSAMLIAATAFAFAHATDHRRAGLLLKARHWQIGGGVLAMLGLMSTTGMMGGQNLISLVMMVGFVAALVWASLQGLHLMADTLQGFVQGSSDGNRGHHKEAPVKIEPANHGRPAEPSPPPAVQVNVHRKTEPAEPSRGVIGPYAVRPLPVLDRLRDWSGTAVLCVVLTLVLTACVAVVSPGFFGIGWDTYDPGRVMAHLGFFCAVTILAAWVITVTGKAVEGTRHDSMARRTLMFLGGLGVGAAAWWLDGYLMFSTLGRPMGTTDGLFAHIGDHSLTAGGHPTLAGYMLFFGSLFAFRRWWWHVDSFRIRRFRPSSLLLTVVIAFLVCMLWSFPASWGVLWATVISAVVQTASVWVSPEKRLVRRDA